MKAYVYVISTPLGLVKVGAAANPKQRVQNLQIGSPVPLALAGQYEMSDRPTAEAVAAALQERFRGRRERGQWLRATPLELRQAIGDRAIVDLYRSSEAKARTAARVAAETAKAEAAQALASATAKKRRRLRQQRRRAAARMLAAGLTQAATAEALGITDRTIRNWAKDQAFQNARARAQSGAERRSGWLREAMRVNAWISRKQLEGVDVIRREVSGWDVSALAPEFSLAKVALLNEFDAAFEKIPRLLEHGNISLNNLREWPVFREIREDPRYRDVAVGPANGSLRPSEDSPDAAEEQSSAANDETRGAEAQSTSAQQETSAAEDGTRD